MCNSKILRCPLVGGIAELSHISHPPCSSALFNSLKLGASRLPYIPSVEIYRQRSAPNFNSPEQNRTIIVRQGVPGAWSSRGADFKVFSTFTVLFRTTKLSTWDTIVRHATLQIERAKRECTGVLIGLYVDINLLLLRFQL